MDAKHSVLHAVYLHFKDAQMKKPMHITILTCIALENQVYCPTTYLGAKKGDILP